MRILKFSLFALPLGLIIGCGASKDKTAEVQEEPLTDYTIETAYMDKSVRPQDDFFQYANGTWIENNPVPPSESRWSSFNELDKANKEKLTSIINNAVDSEHEKGSDQQLIGDYYKAMKNMDHRNAVGVAAIESYLRIIDEVNSKKQLSKITSTLHQYGIGAFFNLYVGQDLKKVEKNITYFSQGGLGLPNRDYYLDESKAEILEQYEGFITKSLDKIDNSQKNSYIAADIVKFEKDLAEYMMKPAELRVPENTYNPMSTKEIMDAFSNFDLEAYLLAINIDKFETIIVGQPKFVIGLNEAIEKTSLETIKRYLKWKVINHYSQYLNQEFVDLNFSFYGTTLSGKKEMKPMIEQAIEEMTGKVVKTALAKEFVALHFSQEAKEKVNTMVDNLLVVYRKRINNLEWMTNETKKEALKKLEAIGRKLGYPDEWKDISRLDIDSKDYIANVNACASYSFTENIRKLHNPVDKKEWGMPAHMVNAYYHPLLNEIAFPAGIMQPPFFDVNAEDAVNYGGIGMVIGHEFTHGFDDMGSKFAADGSFTNWWSQEDRKNFEERTDKLGKTFESFCPIDGHCVNPDLTMGENIADLGGITMAYYAYAMTDEFKSGEKKFDFTPAQRFFLSYAQLWKVNYTDEELKKRIATDPHSPGMYRVNGPLMNCPAFFEAFDVKEKDPMRNNDKIISKIW
jgi:putative endopeptidase